MTFTTLASSSTGNAALASCGDTHILLDAGISAKQIAAALCIAHGTSVLTEGVWDNRYRYVDEFRRMGARIQVDGKVAVIEGVDHLTGAPIHACDLRAGAAMVVAGLAAQGVTEIDGVHHIERGYETIVKKLAAVGADIRVVHTPGEENQSQVG